MVSIGSYTHSEILSQPEIWAAVLEDHAQTARTLPAEFRNTAGKTYLVTGCGSTHYLSLSAASVLRKYGFQAFAAPAAELVYFSQALPPGEPDLIAISRSGTTTETLWAAEKYRKQNKAGKVIAVTTQPDSTLAKQADLCLAAPQAREDSVAQTRSFTSMFLMSQVLAGALANDAAGIARLQKLPEALAKLVGKHQELARRVGEDLSIDRFFFLGGGPFYGLACESMLKTKEMTCSWAEAYHPLEFRHGPMSVVNEHTLVVCLASDSQLAAEVRVMQDMKRLGARTLVLTENPADAGWNEMDTVISLNTGLDEWDRGAIYLPLIQWIAYYRSLAKGLNPDNPTNLSAVVNLS